MTDIENTASKPEWPLVLQALSKSEDPFVVVGGAAMALHGIPRTTLDLDLYVPAQPLILRRVANILMEAFDLVHRPSVLDEEMLIGQWVTFASRDGADIVDLYVANRGEFNRLESNAEWIAVDNTAIAVLSLADLKAMKQRTGRPLDEADVALLDEFVKLRDAEEGA